MMARTPAKLQQVATVYGEVQRLLVRQKLRQFKAEPAKWKAFVAFANAQRPLNEHIDLASDPMSLDPTPERVSVHVEPREMAALALTSAFEMIPTILSMGWMFLRSEPPNYFIASDNPFTALDPVAGIFDAGIGMAGTEISLPVNRTQYFVGSHRFSGIFWRLADSTRVEELNLRTANNSETIFAPKPVFPGSDVLGS